MGEIGDNSNDVNVGQLRALCERIELLEEAKRDRAEDIREVYDEAKGCGYDVKTLRRVIKIRAMDAQKRKEAEAVLELYLAALGLW